MLKYIHLLSIFIGLYMRVHKIYSRIKYIHWITNVYA